MLYFGTSAIFDGNLYAPGPGEKSFLLTVLEAVPKPYLGPDITFSGIAYYPGPG